MREPFTLILSNKNDSRFLINWIERAEISITVSRTNSDILVVDGGSTDNSFEVVKALQRKYDNLHIIVNRFEQNSPLGAFIAGCKITTKKYVSLNSCEDDPGPNYVSRMSQAIQDYPFVDLYLCGAVVEREGREYIRRPFPFDVYISPDYAVKIFRRGYGRLISVVGMVGRRDFILDCWEAGRKATVNFDALYLYAAMFTKGVIALGEPLIRYRSRPGSWGNSITSRDVRHFQKVAGEFFKRAGIYDKARCAGVLGFAAREFSLAAQKILPLLPVGMRKALFGRYCAYDWRVEKL